ncbi:MAG: phosphoribosyltransferase [Halobacteriaceae archaeon]
MSELPEDFDCTVTNWEYIYDLTREVADDVRDAEFEPDVVVALARGGWFAGRCLCDFLGLDDLASLKMEHYVGTAEKGGDPVVRYPMPEGSVEGKDVLVIDDIADTGGSIRRAEEYVTERDAARVETATLQLLGTSEFEPDFVGERLAEWTWVVYPWNFVEDMVELVAGVMAEDGAAPYDEERLRELLADHHGIDRFQLEIAQPGRMDEVLSEMVRRDVVERVEAGPDSSTGYRLVD